MSAIWIAAMGMNLAMAGQEPLFRLVGLYDATGVLAVSKKNEQRFLWKPSTQMSQSCGPSKSPDGLGVFEAEAIANQLSPTLAIVLEYTDPPQYQNAQGEPCTQQEDGICEPVPRPSISNSDITVGLGVDQMAYTLQPMVMPRNLAINIDGYIEPITAKKGGGETEGTTEDDTEQTAPLFDTSRYQKLIRTQLEIELCLEHKVGRGWLGNDAKKLRQAFLLDPPDHDRLDRKYFGGQRDPVPGFIGPSNACVTSSVDMPKDLNASKGGGSMLLTPSDVWGASLRDCEKGIEEGGRDLLRPSKTIPLQLSENGIRQARKRSSKWQGLNIDVVAKGEKETDVYIDVTLDGEPIEELQNVALFPEEGSMIDILARLKHSYPRVGTKLDNDRYVVLMVPNWQIAEGIRRLYSRTCVDDTAEMLCKCEVRSLGSSLPVGDDLPSQLDALDTRLSCKDIDGNVCQLSREVPQGMESSPAQLCLDKLDITEPMMSSGDGIVDAVGWILKHPKQLFIQVGAREKETEGFDVMEWLSGPQEHDESAGAALPNLAGVASGGFAGLQDWGYTVGQLAGRSPIVLPAEERVPWDVSARAQRYKQHSYFIFSAFVLVAFVIAGIRRMADFWTPIPEERAYYWPGRQASNETPDAEGVEMEDAEGAEGAEA